MECRFLEFEVPFLYKICLKGLNSVVECKISLFQSREITFNSSLSLKKLEYLKSLPASLYPRLIQVSTDFSKIIINKGLKGGGVCICPRVKILPTHLKEIFEVIKLKRLEKSEILRKNSKKALEISRRFSLSLKNFYISEKDLIKISQIPPFELFDSLIVLKEFIKKFNKGHFFSHSDLDRPALAIETARKFLYHGIFNTQVSSSPIFNQISFENFRKIFTELKIEFKTLELKVIDSFTYTCLKAAIFACEMPSKLLEFWQGLLVSKRNLSIVFLMLANTEENPVDYQIGILNTLSELSAVLLTSPHYYFIFVDLVETYLRLPNANIDQISSLLYNHLKTLNSANPKTSLKIKSIFFNFVSRCVLYEKVNQDFSNFLLDSLEIMKQSSTQRVLEICFNCLIILRCVKIHQISEKANKINQELKNTNFNIKLKILTIVDLDSLLINYLMPRVKFLPEQKIFTGQFLRTCDLEEIENQLNSMNQVVLLGFSGMGKTRLAGEYANRFESKYKFICIFNCSTDESFDKDIRLCAEKINSVDNNPELNIKSLKSLLKKAEKVLIIFDDCHNLNFLEKFRIPNSHNIVIFNKNKPKNLNFQKLRKLELDKTKQMLKELIKNSLKEEENFNKLSRIIDGWPLAAKMLIADLKKSSSLTDEGIRALPDQKISKGSISTLVKSLIDKLTEDTKILLGFIAFCSPNQIPRKMLQQALLKYHGSSDCNSWWKAVAELEKFYIVDPSLNHFDIQNTIYLVLDGLRKDSYGIHLLNCINQKFRLDLNLSKNSSFRNLFPHIFSILEKLEKPDLVKAEVSLKLSLALIKESSNHTKVSDLCNQAEVIIIENRDARLLSEFYFIFGLLYYKLKDYSKSCKFFIYSNEDDPEISEEFQILRALKLAKLYFKLNEGRKGVDKLKDYFELIDRDADKTKYLKYRLVYADRSKDAGDDLEETCLAYQEVLSESKTCDKVQVSVNLAQCFKTRGKFVEAVDVLSRVYNPEISTSNPQRYLKITLMLAELYESLANYLLSSDYFEKALKFDETLKNQGILLKIAQMAEKAKNTDKAIFFLNLHLENNDLQRDSEMLKHLVKLHEIKEKSGKKEDIEKSIQMIEKFREVKQMSESCNEDERDLNRKLAEKYKKLKDNKKEMHYLKNSLSINYILNNLSEVAKDLEKIGLIHLKEYKISLNQSFLNKSLKSFQESLAIKEKTHGINQVEIFRTLSHIASIYTHKRLYDEVISCLKRFESEDSSFLSFNDPIIGEILKSLAFANKELNRNARSKQVLTKYLNWRRRIFETDDEESKEIEKEITRLNSIQ